MASLYMPDVEVHIAFNAGYTTPAASRTWTDVSAYVELADRITIAWGRQDERSAADANKLTLTLDNSDGRFTALRAASPYYPNVKIGRPIRVRVTPPGGSAVTRFVGFVDEWPVEWDGTDSYAMAKIRASSRLARLGLSAKIKSTPEMEILDDGPSAYWTMGDPSGATSASESSGNLSGQLTVTGDGAAVDFGTGTGSPVDGLSAVTFAGTATDPGVLGAPTIFTGQYLTGSIAPVAVRALRLAVRLTALPGTGVHSHLIDCGNGVLDAGVVSPLVVAVDDAGRVCIDGLVGPSINDGATHDVTLSINPGVEARLYVDGVDRGVGTVVPASSPSVYRVGQGLAGTVCHVAVFGTAVNAPRIAAWSSAVLTGFTGERTDQRAARLLGWAGVAATEVTTETGVETMTYQQTSGQSVVDALRDVESTEGGVLFDGLDGTVTFHNRSHRYLKTASATLNMAAQHVGSDYSPKLDRSTLVNDATVSNPTTGESARSVSATSSTEYGVVTTSATSLANTYDPLAQKASWLVASYAEPRNRVPSLTVDVAAHQVLTPSAQTLLGVTVGEVLAVTNAPSQADTTSPSYFVEGGTDDIGPEAYSITFNLSPTYPTLNTFVIGDATRGQLDSTYVLAL